MKTIEGISPQLAYKLVVEEYFDLTLYKRLHKIASGAEAEMLSKLIPIESGHLAFWQHFFEIEDKDVRLGFALGIKLHMLVFLCRIFGKAGIHLTLQSIEIYGIKKYLDIWEKYKDRELGGAVRRILEDEFKHEDALVTESEKRRVHPERVRDIFLGFNDGLVEILGAISGFFAAFKEPASVLIAGLTVAVAGSISMAASTFAATSSAKEVEDREIEKKQFLGESTEEIEAPNPFVSALIVGTLYFFGALVPVLPVFFGAENVLISVIMATIVIALVSYIVAFLSGMHPMHRIAINMLIIGIAVGSTYVIGTLAKAVFGINI